MYKRQVDVQAGVDSNESVPGIVHEAPVDAPVDTLRDTKATKASSEADLPFPLLPECHDVANSTTTTAEGKTPEGSRSCEHVRGNESLMKAAEAAPAAPPKSLRDDSADADSDATWWVKVSADAQLQDILPAAEIMRRESARSSAPVTTGDSGQQSGANALQQPLDEIMGFQGVLSDEEDSLQLSLIHI